MVVVEAELEYLDREENMVERLRRSIDRKLKLTEKLKGVIDKEHLSVREYLNKKTNKKENEMGIRDASLMAEKLEREIKEDLIRKMKEEEEVRKKAEQMQMMKEQEAPKVRRTEIEYITHEDKVIVTGIKNALSLKELQEQLGTGGFELYMDTLPVYYAIDTNPQHVWVQRTRNSDLTRERVVIQVGTVFSKDEFGQLISVMKEAGIRLGRIMKSKDTKRVVKI